VYAPGLALRPAARSLGAVPAQVDGGLRHIRRTRLHSRDRSPDIPVRGLVVADGLIRADEHGKLP
jgi:hypothetical protein